MRLCYFSKPKCLWLYRLHCFTDSEKWEVHNSTISLCAFYSITLTLKNRIRWYLFYWGSSVVVLFKIEKNISGELQNECGLREFANRWKVLADFCPHWVRCKMNTNSTSARGDRFWHPLPANYAFHITYWIRHIISWILIRAEIVLATGLLHEMGFGHSTPCSGPMHVLLRHAYWVSRLLLTTSMGEWLARCWANCEVLGSSPVWANVVKITVVIF